MGDKERMISEELINSLKSVWMPPHLVQRPNWIKKNLYKRIFMKLINRVYLKSRINYLNWIRKTPLKIDNIHLSKLDLFAGDD